MRKHCSDVCKLRPCLNKESKNSARLRTIVTAALQRQYSQTELIFWIALVIIDHMNAVKSYSSSPYTPSSCISFIYCGSCKFDTFKTFPHLLFFRICTSSHLFVAPFEAVDRGFAVYGKSLYHCNCYM